MKNVIGIDLGTTYSVIAYVNETGKAEIIRNEHDKTITPSVIYFGGNKPLVGDEAKEQQRAGKVEIASFFKRNLDDQNFLLTFHGKDYTAIDLSALLLAYLKEQAERHFHLPVTEAVITVPAYFTHVQRMATIKAGEQAGLHVLKILNEPVAAALGYNWQAQQEEQLALVYDLGGGTFDISLLCVTQSKLQVLATEGDHHLGGKDWDDRLIAYVEEQFAQDFAVKLSDEELESLRFSTERAKHALTVRQSVGVSVQAGGNSRSYTITRKFFEELTRDLLKRTEDLAEKTLSKAGKSWQELHSMLLVGGSTRMPMVRTYAERMLGKAPLTGINPDEAVALGAAIQAHLESATSESHSQGSKALIDVTAHSLGMIVESADRLQHINSIIIQKNMPVPAEQTRSYEMYIRQDGQTQMEVFLTQGESDDPQQCTYVGHYIFSNFPPVTSATAIVDITYRYDRNGIVRISALERSRRQALTLSEQVLPSDIATRFAGKPGGRKAIAVPLTVYLACDLSISMDDQSLDEAKKAMLSFVEHCDLQTISVGLLSYSDATRVDLAATKDQKVLRRAIDQLVIGRTGYGNNGHPFDELYKALAGAQGLRRAVILTDGVWAYQPHAIQQARECRNAGIEIITVGFNEAERSFLSRIASSDKQSFFIERDQLIITLNAIACELTVESGGEEKRND